MDIGALVRSRRREHGISQAQLARRCGTSQSFVSRIERGDLSPTFDAVERLLAGLGEQVDGLAIRRLPGTFDDDPQQRDAARALPVEERVARALAASEFAAAVHGAARR